MMKWKRLFVCAAVVLAAGSLFACAGNDDADGGSRESTAAVTDSGKDDIITADTGNDGTTEADEDKVTYTVRVVDEEGSAIAGAMVQICSESCIPGQTDENGVASFEVAEDDYKVSFVVLPDGYDYSTEETEFYFDGDETELTVTLKALTD